MLDDQYKINTIILQDVLLRKIAVTDYKILYYYQNLAYCRYLVLFIANYNVYIMQYYFFT